MRKILFHMKKLGLYSMIILMVVGVEDSFAQKKEDKQYQAACIGFYNLENLFDTVDQEIVKDEEFTPEGYKNWNTERYYKKLDNMAYVIEKMGTEVSPVGPVLLGVSEVENKSVLEDLAKRPLIESRNYNIVHYNSPDRRGIDVALMYQPKYFKVESSKSFTLKNPEDTSFRSRDQLLVTGELLGERMHVIVVHWPSRRGGEKRSRPLRIQAAKLAKSIIDSIESAEPGAKVALMGDLNDDPTNVSVSKILQATGNKNKVAGDYMYNAMSDLFNKGIGTLAYRDNWNLFDQIILTPSLYRNDSSWRYYGVKVHNESYLKQAEGRFKGYPFRTYVGANYMGGYSDHFPVCVYLIKEQEL